MMSDSSQSDSDPKTYKLKGRHDFAAWKQKTLSSASAKGYEKYIIQDVLIQDEAVLEEMEDKMIEETNADLRRKLKAKLAKLK